MTRPNFKCRFKVTTQLGKRNFKQGESIDGSALSNVSDVEILRLLAGNQLIIEGKDGLTFWQQRFKEQIQNNPALLEGVKMH